MFNEFYSFKSLGSSSDLSKKHLIKIYQFFFDTEDRIRYIICVEEYPDDIFIIKYYPRKYKQSKNRFNILTNTGRFTKIVRTSVEVLGMFLKRFPNSHFGFIGARKYCSRTKKFKEDVGDCSTRFRLYKYVVENFINPDSFEHHFDKSNNTYLLINVNVENTYHVKDRAAYLFEECMN